MDFSDRVFGTLKRGGELGGRYIEKSRFYASHLSTREHREVTVSPALITYGGSSYLMMVLFENHRQDGRYRRQKVCPTVTAKYGTGGNNAPLIVIDGREYDLRRITPTECARLQGFPDDWGRLPVIEDMTDEEAQLWQDVFDTQADVNGREAKKYTKEQLIRRYNKLYSDSAEYKMWGNGVALPNALYVMENIARCFEVD